MLHMLALGLHVPPMDLAARLPGLIAHVPAAYSAALVSNPLATRTCTAAVLALGGDALAQARHSPEPCAGRVSSSRRVAKKRFDTRRAGAFVVSECLYRGFVQLPVFAWIIRTFSGKGLHAIIGANIQLCATLERTLFSQLVVSPGVYYPMYFMLTGLLQGLSCKRSFARWRAQFPRLYGWNLLFWIPTHYVQFAFVPTRFKVPYTCLAGFVWNFILSAIAGSVARFREARAAAALDDATTPPLSQLTASLEEPEHDSTLLRTSPHVSST